MNQPAYTLHPGSILAHNDIKFTIENVLGAGGFGITYKAVYEKEVEIEEQYQSIKTMAKVPVAIKELFLEGKCVRSGNQTVSLQSLGEEEFGQFKDRFLQEAETLSKFNMAPGLLHVISYFENNNTAYMVTEYVEGKTLRELVNENGILAENTALDYIAKLAQALIPVHDEGLLHRDIKPDNIMITPRNHSVLIDFGAAREFVADTTITNSVILTPGYAPIEQYGQKRRRGPYTDIYAIGATLFFCLTGKKPDAVFDREPGETVEIQGASEKVNTILRKAMAYGGEDRYQSCQEFVSDIEGNTESDTVIEQKKEELRKTEIAEEELEELTDLTHKIEAEKLEIEEEEPAESEPIKSKSYLGRRFLASWIDGFIYSILSLPFSIYYNFLVENNVRYISRAMWFCTFLIGLLSILFWMIYHAEFERRRGWTPGKFIMKIMIIPSESTSIIAYYKRSFFKFFITPSNVFLVTIFMVGLVGFGRSLNGYPPSDVISDSIGTATLSIFILNIISLVYFAVKKRLYHDIKGQSQVCKRSIETIALRKTSSRRSPLVITSFLILAFITIFLSIRYVSIDKENHARVESNGMKAVKSFWSGKWGYENVSGRVTIEHEFDWVGDFASGLAEVRKSDWSGSFDGIGLIHKEGNSGWLYSSSTRYKMPLTSSYKLVRSAKGYFRRSYDYVDGFRYEVYGFYGFDGVHFTKVNIEDLRFNVGSGEFAYFLIDNKYGLANKKGEIMLPWIYEDKASIDEAIDKAELLAE